VKEYHYMTQNLLRYAPFCDASKNPPLCSRTLQSSVSFCKLSQLKKRKCTQDALETSTPKIKYCDILLRRYGDADYKIQDLQYCM
jgi:hypothetical protein